MLTKLNKSLFYKLKKCKKPLLGTKNKPEIENVSQDQGISQSNSTFQTKMVYVHCILTLINLLMLFYLFK